MTYAPSWDDGTRLMVGFSHRPAQFANEFAARQEAAIEAIIAQGGFYLVPDGRPDVPAERPAPGLRGGSEPILSTGAGS